MFSASLFYGTLAFIPGFVLHSYWGVSFKILRNFCHCLKWKWLCISVLHINLVCQFTDFVKITQSPDPGMNIVTVQKDRMDAFYFMNSLGCHSWNLLPSAEHSWSVCFSVTKSFIKDKHISEHLNFTYVGDSFLLEMHQHGLFFKELRMSYTIQKNTGKRSFKKIQKSMLVTLGLWLPSDLDIRRIRLETFWVFPFRNYKTTPYRETDHD